MFKDMCEKLTGKRFICTFSSVNSGVENLSPDLEERDSCWREPLSESFSILLSKIIALTKVFQNQLLLPKTLYKMASY